MYQRLFGKLYRFSNGLMRQSTLGVFMFYVVDRPTGLKEIMEAHSQCLARAMFGHVHRRAIDRLLPYVPLLRKSVSSVSGGTTPGVGSK